MKTNLLKKKRMGVILASILISTLMGGCSHAMPNVEDGFDQYQKPAVSQSIDNNAQLGERTMASQVTKSGVSSVSTLPQEILDQLNNMKKTPAVMKTENSGLKFILVNQDGTQTRIDNNFKYGMKTSTVAGGSRTLVALADISDNIDGTRLEWDKENSGARVNKDNIDLFYQFGKKASVKNGKISVIDIAATVDPETNRTFLPFRDILENLGHEVDYRHEEKTVYVIEPGAKAPEKTVTVKPAELPTGGNVNKQKPTVKTEKGKSKVGGAMDTRPALNQYDDGYNILSDVDKVNTGKTWKDYMKVYKVAPSTDKDISKMNKDNSEMMMDRQIYDISSQINTNKNKGTFGVDFWKEYKMVAPGGGKVQSHYLGEGRGTIGIGAIFLDNGMVLMNSVGVECLTGNEKVVEIHFEANSGSKEAYRWVLDEPVAFTQRK